MLKLAGPISAAFQNESENVRRIIVVAAKKGSIEAAPRFAKVGKKSLDAGRVTR